MAPKWNRIMAMVVSPIQSLVLSNLKDLATHLSPIMLVIPS